MTRDMRWPWRSHRPRHGLLVGAAADTVTKTQRPEHDRPSPLPESVTNQCSINDESSTFPVDPGLPHRGQSRLAKRVPLSPPEKRLPLHPLATCLNCPQHKPIPQRTNVFPGHPHHAIPVAPSRTPPVAIPSIQSISLHSQTLCRDRANRPEAGTLMIRPL